MHLFVSIAGINLNASVIVHTKKKVGSRFFIFKLFKTLKYFQSNLDCGKNREYSESSCSCECKGDGQCKGPKTWCKNSCRCVCPTAEPAGGCAAPLKWDDDTCSCSCPAKMEEKKDKCTAKGKM